MSLRFTRCLHYKRVPNYHGFWTEILHSAKPTPRKTLTVEQVPVVKRIPIAIPFEPVIEEITTIPKVKTVVYLKGNPIQLPTKPESPDNCCMSGCAHCVWDMYAEDMEEYASEKSNIREKFIQQNEPLPKELEKGNKDDALEEMDPSMKAFLDMEKKLKNM